VPEWLELSDEARAKIDELQALADRAGDGDKVAREELRNALREAAPEIIARCSNTARLYRRVLAKVASGGNPLVEEAIGEAARRMAVEIAGEDPTPLEVLLSDRIASLWVLVELHDALIAAWHRVENEDRASPDFLLKMVKLQEASNRRYLAAIRELARVRKLQAGSPPPRHNTQINILTG
jgi:hypothetical protein